MLLHANGPSPRRRFTNRETVTSDRTAGTYIAVQRRMNSPKSTASSTIDPTYRPTHRFTADLREHRKVSAASKDGMAHTITDVSRDSLAEGLGEAFLRTATSGEDLEEDILDEDAPEISDSFVETTAEEEFAYDTDESNPIDATREPFPKT
jgi:hypothetical protein